MMNAMRLEKLVNLDGRPSVRPHLVFWTDEDVGQRSIVVLAIDSHTAREIVENLTGQVALRVSKL